MPEAHPDQGGVLPKFVGLCPSDHVDEFYMWLEPGESKRCPLGDCEHELVVYAPEVPALRALCAEAAEHLRTLPAQSDVQDGLMAQRLEEAARS